MMFVLHVLLGAALSFIGSLPFGMINLTAADLTLRRGDRAGRIYSAGAALVEFIQAFIALRFTQFLLENRELDLGFQITAAVVFAALALYYFFWAPPVQANTSPRRRFEVPYFWQGVFVSSLNLMVFPYWMFYASYLRAGGWLSQGHQDILVFSSGVFLGTFLLLLLYVRLATFLKTRASRWSKWINRSIAWIFTLFFMYQIWKLLPFIKELW